MPSCPAWPTSNERSTSCRPGEDRRGTHVTSIQMPQLGETIIEGTILKWLKAEGDTIERDEPLFEISTDKVDTEVPSPVAGTVTKILVEEGATVPVGTELAEIDSGEGAAGGASAGGVSADAGADSTEIRRRMGHSGALSPRCASPPAAATSAPMRPPPPRRRRPQPAPRRPQRRLLRLRSGGRGRRSCRRWCGGWRRSIRSISHRSPGQGPGGGSRSRTCRQ
jgi:2-oxoglutarate dehydrogenase E2 component (dihydrolipoamide succinyltransferase)